MTALEQAMIRIARFFDAESIPYMIFGGYAVLHWGEPRVTRDIDVKLLLDGPSLEALVPRLIREFPSRTPNPLAFVTELGVLPVNDSDGTPIDVVVGSLPLEREAVERAIPLTIGSHTVRLCAAEDLILHKLVSDRPRDFEDIVGVVLRQREHLDRGYLDPRVRDLTTGLERPDRLAAFEAVLTRAGLPALDQAH